MFAAVRRVKEIIGILGNFGGDVGAFWDVVNWWIVGMVVVLWAVWLIAVWVYGVVDCGLIVWCGWLLFCDVVWLIIVL